MHSAITRHHQNGIELFQFVKRQISNEVSNTGLKLSDKKFMVNLIGYKEWQHLSFEYFQSNACSASRIN